MSDLKTQIVVTAENQASKVMDEVAQDATSMGQAVESAGDVAAKGMDKVSKSAGRAAADMDRVTKQIAQQIERLTATLEAGEKGTAAFFRALATIRGADVGALEPLLTKLEAVREKQAAIAKEAKGVEFIANLREQLATLGMGEAALVRYRAAQAGVAEQAEVLLVQIEATKRALKEKADADALATREAEKAAAAQQAMLASLREQISTYGMGEIELMKYRAAQAGISDSVAPLIAQLTALKEATKQKAEADRLAAASAKEQEAQLKAQQSFLASLRDQVSTLAMSEEALLRYRAAQAGVASEASHLITQLENIKASLRSKAQAEREAADAAAAQADAQKATQKAQREMLAGLREQIAVFGMSESALMSYRAAQAGVEKEAAPLIAQLTALKEATRAKASADRAAAEAAREQAQQLSTQKEFVGSLRDQIATMTLSESALMRYRAAQAGVAAEAGPLILQIEHMRAAMSAKAQTDREAARAADELAASQRAQKSAQDSFMSSLRTQVATQGLDPKGLMRYRAEQLGVAREAEPLIAQLKAAEKQMSATGISAGQTANALRQLPAQFTDIFVSLASGQQPLTVFLQQGGQIKDMFGSVENAAKAVGGALMKGLSNPIFLSVAALAALIMAYKQGSDEGDAYVKSLIMTGNAAGTTSGQLGAMAADISIVAGTQSKAAEVLAKLAGSGFIAAAGMQTMATAAVKAERDLGIAIDETVAKFVELGKAPLEASMRLNESTNYLTESVYLQIKALEEQGNKTEAARVAQDAWARAVQERSDDVVKSLGSLQTAWRFVTEEAKKAWDAMLGIGRADTVESEIARMKARLADVRKIQAGGQLFIPKIGDVESFDVSKTVKNYEALIARMEESKAMGDRVAKAQGDQAKRTKETIESDTYFTKFDQTIDKQAKLNKELREYAQMVGKAQGSGADRSAEQQAKDIAAIREKYADKSGSADHNRALKAQIEEIAQQLKWLQTVYKDSQAHIDDVLKDGTITEGQAIRARAELRAREIADEQDNIQQRMKLMAGQKGFERDLAQAKGEYARLGTLALQQAGQADADARRADLADARKAYETYAAMIEKVRGETDKMAEKNAGSAAGLSVDPGARVTAEYEAQLTALQRQRAEATRDISMALVQEQDPERVKQLSASLQALLDQFDRSKQLLGAGSIADFLKQGNNIDFAAGFDAASQSLGVFTQQFQKLLDLQSNYTALLKIAGTDEAQLAALRKSMATQQVAAYGNIAGAAKGFFKEGSKGYKALSAAEKAFRAFELAMAVRNAMEKMGLIEAVTAAKVIGDQTATASAAASVGPEVAAATAKGQANAAAAVANQGNGDPYSAFPRIAAMAAIMAALGFATGAFGGGGGNSKPVTNTGTGTVLGDSSAQSESIANAVEKLQDIDTMTMRYSAQMLAALKSIEANISGVTTLLIQSGSLEASTSGIQTGAIKASGLQGLIGIDNKLVGNIVGALPGIGGALKGLISRDFQKLFGASQSIIGTGITGSPQTVGSINASGFDASYYADIQSKQKFLGMTTSTKNSTQLTPADAELERQFSLIIKGFSDTLLAAGSAIGVSTDSVKAKLNAFVVDIGRIDLQGLTGEQINERLTAVFGALGDNMAKAAITGFADFQAVGEGYLETVVRVATGVEDARNALRGLGLSIADLASVTNKQSDDIGAELVRQSILAAESSTRSVQRTVTDIVTTWKQIPWDPSKYGRFAEVMNRIAPMMMQVAESVTRVVTELETIPNGIGEIIQNLQGSAEEIASAYRTLTGLRDSLRLLSLNGDAVSYSLLNGAGGLQALSDSVAAFEESFFSESDKVNFQASRMAQAFQKLGFSLPMSKDGFVALVRGIDTSTDAGKELLGSVLGLSSGLAELLDSMESLKSSALANTDAFESKYLTTFERVALQSARMAAQFQSIGVAMPASIEEFKALVLGIDSGSQAGKDLLNKILPLANDFGSLSDSIEALSEAAIASTGSFERNVLSPFERIALQSTRLSSQFQDIGIAMPKNNEEFRSLVLGIDSSTEAGRSLLNKILPLADGFTTLTDSITSIGKAVSDEITRIRGLIGQGSATQNFASLQAEFAAKTAAARAGEKSALDALPHLSKDLLDLAGQQASSRADLVRMQAATAASLQTTLDIVKGNLNTGTDQNASLVSWMNGFKSVPNAGTDQSASLVSWMDALKQVQTPVIQTPTVPAPVVTPPVTEAPVSTPSPVVNPNAGQPDWAGYVAKYADLTAEFQRLMSGSASDAIRKGITTPELYGKWQFENQWAAEGGWRTVPTFAVGGMHAGGLRIVGEHGPELEASGAARYYSAEQTAQMWRGGGGGSDPALLAELQALRSEVAAFRQESQAGDSAIASHTGKAARILERVTPDGDAVATREAEALP